VGRGSRLGVGEADVKKSVAIALLVVLVVLVSVGSSFAWSRGGGVHHGGFHGRGVVVVGPGWGWGGPWWGYGWGGYYPPPYYYQQPQVVVQPAPIYVERNEPQAAPESFWYYCPNTKAYYPSVPSCSEAWVKVPPRSE
jgi:hypothetical protein